MHDICTHWPSSTMMLWYALVLHALYYLSCTDVTSVGSLSTKWSSLILHTIGCPKHCATLCCHTEIKSVTVSYCSSNSVHSVHQISDIKISGSPLLIIFTIYYCVNTLIIYGSLHTGRLCVIVRPLAYFIYLWYLVCWEMYSHQLWKEHLLFDGLWYKDVILGGMQYEKYSSTNWAIPLITKQGLRIAQLISVLDTS